MIITADESAESEHCFDLSLRISAVGVTDIYSRQYIAEKDLFLRFLHFCNNENGVYLDYGKLPATS